MPTGLRPLEMHPYPRPEDGLSVFPSPARAVVKVFYKLAAKPPTSILTAKGRVNLKNPRGESPVNL